MTKHNPAFIPSSKICLLTNSNYSETPCGHNMTEQNATCSCTALLPINLTLVDQDKFLSTVFYTYTFEWIILTVTILVTDFNTVGLFNSHLINSFWQKIGFYSLHQNNLLIEIKKTQPICTVFQCHLLQMPRKNWRDLDQDAKCNLCTLLFRKKKLRKYSYYPHFKWVLRKAR